MHNAQERPQGITSRKSAIITRVLGSRSLLSQQYRTLAIGS